MEESMNDSDHVRKLSKLCNEYYQTKQFKNELKEHFESDDEYCNEMLDQLISQVENWEFQIITKILRFGRSH